MMHNVILESEPERFDLEAKTNPFAINLVVDNISRFLSFEDLKTCRRLNRLWRKTLDKVFLKQCSHLEILGHEENYENNTHRVSIIKFMEIVEDLEHADPLANLFRRYKNLTLDDKQQIHLLPVFRRLLLAFGPQLTSLHVHSSVLVQNVDDFVALVSCKFTQNLESLCLFICYTAWASLEYTTSDTVAVSAKKNDCMRKIKLGTASSDLLTAHIENISWLNVLSLFPNLKILDLYGWSHEVCKEIFNAMSEMRRTSRTTLDLTRLSYFGGYKLFTAWKTTDIGLDQCKQVTNLFTAADFNLKILRLDDFASMLNLSAINNQRMTLKSLELDSEKTNEPFPLMPCLNHLYIGQALNFTFLAKAPKLFRLQTGPPINNSLPLVWPDLPTVIPHVSLEYFKSVSGDWRILDLAQFFSWTPNITFLEMQLNNISFGCVCEHLVKLKTLVVYGEELTDAGILGNDDDETVQILKLRDLELFRMTGLTDSEGLTLRSIMDGFLLLDNLRVLVLSLRQELPYNVMECLSAKLDSVMITIL